MRKTITAAIACTLILVSLGGTAAYACDVLLLGDTEAELQVQSALEAAGHSVMFGGLHYDWDGVTPNVNDFDVVVLLDGQSNGHGFVSFPAAEAAIVEFVHGGGGLIVTEYVTQDVAYGNFGPDFGDLMPCYYTNNATYGSTWTVLDTGHFLATGLPASWYDGATWSEVIPYPSAAIVIETEQGTPLLSYRTDAGGTVVHFNHDMTWWIDQINPTSMQALVNSAAFICLTTPVDESNWGSIKSMY